MTKAEDKGAGSRGFPDLKSLHPRKSRAIRVGPAQEDGGPNTLAESAGVLRESTERSGHGETKRHIHNNNHVIIMMMIVTTKTTLCGSNWDV